SAMIGISAISTLVPYTTLFRSHGLAGDERPAGTRRRPGPRRRQPGAAAAPAAAGPARSAAPRGARAGSAASLGSLFDHAPVRARSEERRVGKECRSRGAGDE